MPGYARPTTITTSNEVVVTPVGTISSGLLQGALVEIDSDLQTLDSIKVEIPVYATEAARDSGMPSPNQSQIVFITSLNTFQYWNGTVWTALGAGGLPVDFLLAGA